MKTNSEQLGASAAPPATNQRRRRAVEFRVIFGLYFCRVHAQFKANYERLFGAPTGNSGQQQLGASSAERWHWAGFPRLPAVFAHYERLANAYMLYVVARNLFLADHLNWFIELEKPSHCYLIGYFHVHPGMSRLTGTLFSLAHLLWRLFQARARRPYFIPVILFMLVDDADQARFERELAASALDEARARAAPGKASASARQADGDPVFRLLRRLMCYKVDYNHYTSYRLRPNRTGATRHAMHKRAARCTTYLGAFFIALASVVLAIIVLIEFNDRQYLTRYPKCDAHLELMALQGQVGFWDYSFRSHQLLTVAWDLLENIIIWIDSGEAIIFCMATIYLLNYDLQLYWRELDRKLRGLHLRVRALHAVERRAGADGLSSISSLAGRNSYSAQLDEQLDWTRQKRQGGRERLHKSRFRWTESGGKWPGGEPSNLPTPLELEEAVRDLQAHFYDFFQQIAATDLFVSDIITGAIAMWFVVFATYGRTCIKMMAREGDQSNMLRVMVLVGGFSAITVSATTFALLELHRNCLRSYTTLCSLIAHDRSRHKLRFLLLLEFYTVKKRSAYTLFHQYPYTKTSYLTIFGWSISCLFILDNLFAR